MTTTSASRAMRAQISGPMPAGSPEVSATRGLLLLKPQLDVRLVAELSQPFRIRLLGLAVANRLSRLQALALNGCVARAPLEHLDEVVAERRADRLAHFAHLQLLIGLLEFRYRVAGKHPVELAAARGRAIVGIGACQLAEVRAAGHDALAQVQQLPASIGFRDHLVRADEDVAD